MGSLFLKDSNGDLVRVGTAIPFDDPDYQAVRGSTLLSLSPGTVDTTKKACGGETIAAVGYDRICSAYATLLLTSSVYVDWYIYNIGGDRTHSKRTRWNMNATDTGNVQVSSTFVISAGDTCNLTAGVARTTSSATMWSSGGSDLNYMEWTLTRGTND